MRPAQAQQPCMPNSAAPNTTSCWQAGMQGVSHTRMCTQAQPPSVSPVHPSSHDAQHTNACQHHLLIQVCPPVLGVACLCEDVQHAVQVINSALHCGADVHVNDGGTRAVGGQAGLEVLIINLATLQRVHLRQRGIRHMTSRMLSAKQMPSTRSVVDAVAAAAG